MKPTIGLIGVGNMGKNHCRVLSEVLAPRYGLNVMIHDPRIEANGSVTYVGKYTLPPGVMHGEWPDVLAEVKASKGGLVVATPTDTHLDYFGELVPLLVEKPYALDFEKVPTLPSAIDMVGYIERYNSAFQELLRIHRNGVLGDLLAIETNRVNDMAHAEWKPGGIILDLGIHDFDLIRQLMHAEKAEPIHVAGDVIERDGVDIHASFDFRFGDVACRCRLSWMEVEKARTMVVYGTYATAFCDLMNRHITLSFADHAPRQQIRCSEREPLEAELEEWILAYVLKRKQRDAWLDWSGHYAQEMAERIKSFCRKIRWQSAAA